MTTEATEHLLIKKLNCLFLKPLLNSWKIQCVTELLKIFHVLVYLWRNWLTCLLLLISKLHSASSCRCIVFTYGAYLAFFLDCIRSLCSVHLSQYSIQSAWKSLGIDNNAVKEKIHKLNNAGQYKYKLVEIVIGPYTPIHTRTHARNSCKLRSLPWLTCILIWSSKSN